MRPRERQAIERKIRAEFQARLDLQADLRNKAGTRLGAAYGCAVDFQHRAMDARACFHAAGEHGEQATMHCGAFHAWQDAANLLRKALE